MSNYFFKGAFINKINNKYPLTYNNNGCLICENNIFTKKINTLTLKSNTNVIDFNLNISGNEIDFTNTTFISNPTKLQETYENSLNGILLNNINNTFNIKDSISGVNDNIFSVENYLLVSPNGIETNGLNINNLSLNSNTISTISGDINISSNNLLYLNNFEFTNSDGRYGNIVSTNGSKKLNIVVPLKQLSISDILFVVSELTYTPIVTFRYGGLIEWNDIIKIIIIAETNASNWFIRLYDITNLKVITELNIRDRFVGYTIYEITNIQNLPENEAVLQFQAYKGSGRSDPIFYSTTLYFK